MDTAITVAELVERIESGQNLYVLQSPNAYRLLKITSRFGKLLRAIDLKPDAYEDLMRELVTALAAAHGSTFAVAIKTDHYGRSRVTVSSGLFGWRKSRAIISPRHVALLERLLPDGMDAGPQPSPNPAVG